VTGSHSLRLASTFKEAATPIDKLGQLVESDQLRSSQEGNDCLARGKLRGEEDKLNGGFPSLHGIPTLRVHTINAGAVRAGEARP